MMNYEIFKEVVVEKLKDYLPEKYQEMRLEVCTVEKVNRMLDGISLFEPDKTTGVSPTIYINDLYEQYQSCGDLQKVLESTAETIEHFMKKMPQIPSLKSVEIKENIVFQLINTEQNREMLSHMPHREFQDLSIVYRLIVKMDDEGMQNIPIKNEVAEMIGLNEEQLFRCAVENTKRLLPPCTKTMNDVIKELFIKDGMPAEMAEIMIGEMPEDRAMYVITNDRGVNGAASMLYEDQLHTLSQQLEDDLYIIPSSIHEVIAIPVKDGNPDELAQMVSEVNMTQVELGDRLSNQVYHYDKDLRKLTLATDTPNKRLDGIVSEPPMIYEAKQSR